MEEEMVCGGCGRSVEPPPDLPAGGRFLCSRCHFMLSLPPAGSKVVQKERAAVWNTKVAWIGLALLLVAGMTPSLLFGYFAGRVHLGYIMAFALVPVLCIPAYIVIFRGMRNVQLNQAILYSLLGPWLLAWSFLPGVDPVQGRILLWFGGAATALGLGFMAITLYSMRTLPRA